MKLGMVVGLGPGHIVLDGDRAAPPPIFGPCLLRPNGGVDQDATWYRGRPHTKPLCVRWRPSPLRKGHSNPTFRPISIVAKRLHESGCHFVRTYNLGPGDVVQNDVRDTNSLNGVCNYKMAL